MDTFRITNIKQEKAKAISKHRQIQKFGNFFRIIEICVFLVVVLKVSIQLPIALKNSSEYFKNVSVSLFGPRFVFIIGNAIVIVLFVQFSSRYSTKDNPVDHIYEEFVEKSEKAHNFHRYQKAQNLHRYEVQNRVENRRKQSISEKAIVINETKKNDYRRSKSENFKRPSCEKSSKDLRRSVTEKFEKRCNSKERSVALSYPEDNMSNEEFRRTIEAFIERQQRIRREEEHSVV